MANETIRKRSHDSVDRIMDKADDMVNGSKKAMSHLKERAIRAKENVDRYIEKNPERSVWIAAGVGAIIGAALTAIIMRKRH